MHLMRRPHEIDFVAAAVDPVINEIVRDQCREPDPDRIGGQRADTHIFKSPNVNTESEYPDEDGRHLTQNPEVETRDGIGDVVRRDSATMCDPGLEQDRGHEDGDGVNDRIHGKTIAGSDLDQRTGQPRYEGSSSFR